MSAAARGAPEGVGSGGRAGDRTSGTGGFGRLAARDGAVVALAVAAWWLLAERSAGDGFVADASGFVAGVLLGATAFVAHEWGHLLGAFAGGSRVDASPSLASPFVFRFSPSNSLAQFLGMSFAGFAATGAALWVCYAQLPDAWLASRVARGATAFLALLGITLELPLVAVGLYRGATPGEAAVHLPEAPPPVSVPSGSRARGRAG